MSPFRFLVVTLFALVLPNGSNAQAPPHPELLGDPLPAGALARLGKARLFQEGCIKGVALSPDGKQLAVESCAAGWGGCSIDHNINVWDAETGTKAWKMNAGQFHTSFTPDGKSLVASEDNAVKLWDAATGKPMTRPVFSLGKDRINSFALSADGKLLALADSDNAAIHLWDVATGKRIRVLTGPAGSVQQIALAPDGRTVVSSSAFEQQPMYLCDTATGKVLHMWHPENAAKVNLAYSPDGKIVAAATSYMTLYLWDVASGRELQRIEEAGNCCVFAADGKSIIAAGCDSMVRVWDVATGRTIKELQGQHGWYGSVEALALSADGTTLAAASSGAPVFLWKLPSGERIHRAEAHESGITALAYSPDGRIMASASQDRTVRLWDTATGKPLHCLRGHRDSVRVVAFAPDGKTVASGGRDSEVYLWDVASGREICRLRGHVKVVGAVAFTPDGHVLVSAERDGTIHFWDAGTGLETRRLRQFAGQDAGSLDCLLLSPDGETLVAGGKAAASADESMIVWNRASGKTRYVLEPAMAEHLKQQVFRLGDGYHFIGAAFSPDGKVLLTNEVQSGQRGYHSAKLRLWEAATGREILKIEPLEGQTYGWYGYSSATSLALSPDGRFLAAENGLGRDGLFLWDLATGRQLPAPPGRWHQVLFAPDGRSLAASAPDGTITIWDMAFFQRGAEPFAVNASPRQRSLHWDCLEESDALRVHRTMQTLVAAPEASVALLSAQLRPAAAADPKRVAQLLADLDSNQFEARRRATEELETLAERAAPDLRAILKGKPSLEVRRRVEALLEKVEQGEARKPNLRLARSVTVLERIGTPEARRLLASLAHGTPDAFLTQQAQAALRRLDRRPLSMRSLGK